VLDAALNKVATCTRLDVCTTEPTTLTEATSTNSLANATLSGVDYTVGVGDTSGRKVAIAEQADISVGTSGTAQHIALSDGVDLLYVTTCTSQSLTSGNTVTVPTWDVEIADPS